MKVLDKWWFWFSLCFVLYANTLKHAYAVDDMIVISNNKLTQEGVKGIPDIFKHSYLYGYDGREDESYRPLTLTSFAIEKSFFNSNPMASHFVQILLYGLCLVVVFKFLSNLFGEERKRLVYVICLLFLLHPIHTEVVANVKSRDELLSAVFLFGGLMYYSRWLINEVRFNFVMAVVLFFAATLSKETAVLGVLLFPATFYYMKSSRFREIFVGSAVFIVPFLLYFGIRAFVLSDVLIKEPIDPVANSLALAANGGELFSSNLAIFSKYMQLLVFPNLLSWDYSVATLPIVSFGTVSALFGLIALLFILGVTVFGLIRKQPIGFGGLIFICTFALTSNFFFLINCPLGERFMFMPVLGVIVILVLMLEGLLKKLSKNVALGFVGVFTLFFAGRTFTRNMDWKDNLSIYESGVEVCPNSVKAHFNLATEYLEQGNRANTQTAKVSWYHKSLDHFKTAKKIYPSYVNTYENMAYVYAELGKIDLVKAESISDYREGLKELNIALDSLELEKPTLYQNKFFILEQLIRLVETSDEKSELMAEIINTVEHKKVKTAEDYQRWLYYLNQLKEVQELITVSKEMMNVFPENGALVFELSKTLFTEKKYTESLELITLFVKANPNDLGAKSNLGMLLEILGKKKEALAVYEEILVIDPEQEHTRQLYDKLKGKR